MLTIRLPSWIQICSFIDVGCCLSSPGLFFTWPLPYSRLLAQTNAIFSVRKKILSKLVGCGGRNIVLVLFCAHIGVDFVSLYLWTKEKKLDEYFYIWLPPCWSIVTTHEVVRWWTGLGLVILLITSDTFCRLSTRSLLHAKRSLMGWVLHGPPWCGVFHRRKRKRGKHDSLKRGARKSWHRCLLYKKLSSKKMRSYWRQWKLESMFSFVILHIYF